MSDYQFEKSTAIREGSARTLRMGVEAGVMMATGSDTADAQGDCSAVMEAVTFVVVGGMTPLQAIESATANGPRCLGHLGLAPLSGQLKVGYEADILGLIASPLDDIYNLADRENVAYVWKGGQLFKKAA